MKTLIKSAIIAGISIIAATGVKAQSTTATQNATQNLVTGGNATFTFNQFNSSLGNLTAVDLIIQSSTIQGNLTVTRNSGSRTFTQLGALIQIDSAPGLSGGYASDGLDYLRSPSGSFTVNASNSSRVVTVTGTTQSLIGASPITLSLDSSAFSSYIGLGQIAFTGLLDNYDSQSGSGSATVNDSNLLAPTTLSLRYTYSTAPSPVPETGQVAASLLLLGGIGGYIFIKRRGKRVVTAA